MSLVADSPVNSSSSDDFAAYLDAELEQVSSEESPVVAADDGTDGDDDFEQDRLKRRKVKEWEDRDSSLVSGGATASQLDTPASTSDQPCSHPGFFRDMCMLCGQVVELSGVALGYIHKHIRLDSEEMARIKHVDLERKLKRDRKLYLVVDLDHTLLNSTTLTNIAPNEDHLKQGDPNASLYRLDKMHMLTKLRPFVHTFLREAYSMYEMHIYTMAERSYALEMAKLLDPTGIYFGDRIISQSDCTKRHQKGLDVVVGAENAVLILDDTDGVWQQHRDNLILMERYHYFASSSGQFGLHGKSLSERKMDESETDGVLSTILKILKRVHHEFFLNLDTGSDDVKDRDVRMVLKMIRQEILQGCKIVFSHLFPRICPPTTQPLWKMAVELGAVCMMNVDSSVTHVVAGDRGTDKARWALRENKFLVNPGWIEAANYLWRRLPEKDFTVPHSKG